jgi:ribosome-binding factor A
MPGRRPERIAEQIREEVSQIILGDLQDRRIGLATVTDVELSPDLRHARVYVSVLGPDRQIQESLEALSSAEGFVRRQLSQALRLRYTPHLHFVQDETVRTASRIEEILKEENEKLREQQGAENLPKDSFGTSSEQYTPESDRDTELNHSIKAGHAGLDPDP